MDEPIIRSRKFAFDCEGVDVYVLTLQDGTVLVRFSQEPYSFAVVLDPRDAFALAKALTDRASDGSRDGA